MAQCFVCGRKKSVREYKLPHGTIHLCFQKRCHQGLVYKTEHALPLVWIDGDDLKTDVPFTDEDFASLEKYLPDGADEASQYLWEVDDSFGNMFHEAVFEAGKQMEVRKIEDAKPADLLLMIGKLRFKQNEELLEAKLKGPASK